MKFDEGLIDKKRQNVNDKELSDAANKTKIAMQKEYMQTSIEPNGRNLLFYVDGLKDDQMPNQQRNSNNQGEYFKGIGENISPNMTSSIDNSQSSRGCSREFMKRKFGLAPSKNLSAKRNRNHCSNQR